MNETSSSVAVRTSAPSVKEFRYIWKIEKMNLRPQGGQYWSSGSFDSPDGETSWYMILSRKIFLDDYVVALHLKNKVNKVWPKATLTLIRHDGQKGETTPCQGVEHGRFVVEWRRQYLLENEYLMDDTLTIQCDIIIARDVHVDNVTASRSTLPDPSHSAMVGKKLFDNMALHSDVVLSLGDSSFPAHKAILAAQSPVFASMFEHNMLESRTNTVHIPDLRAEVMLELLRFMYTGNVHEIDEVQEELFLAAAKYDVERLKEICEVRLIASLNQENFYRVLILAYLHESMEMKHACVEYVRKNPSVMESQEWEETLENRPRLLSQLCRSLVPRSRKRAADTRTTEMEGSNNKNAKK